MAKHAVLSAEREVKTFADLSHGANVLLEKAKNDPAGSYYTTMGTLILRAFTFEAYLNHLGAKLKPYWDSIETISVESKYQVLCATMNLKPDFGKRPYQTIRQLLRFRNAIAHGRSEIVKKTEVIDSEYEPTKHAPKAEWEEYCTEGNAVRAAEDVSAIIKDLHKAAGLGDYPFTHGLGVASLSLLAEGQKSQTNKKSNPKSKHGKKG